MIEKLGADHRLSIAEREAIIVELAPHLTGKYVYLQTCNRVELYRGDGNCDIPLLRHLFRVAAGLESKMLGEAHIQGQVKRAYLEARENEHVNSGLHRIFQRALRCGKRVRSETAIATGAVSHSHAAVLAVKNWNVEFKALPVLIVGVNDLTQRIANFLRHQHESNLTVANRTPQNISTLSLPPGTHAMSLSDLPHTIDSFSVIISATTSPTPIIHKEWFTTTKERLFIDMAVPRDIDPTMAELPMAKLMTVEDLEELVAHSIERRENEIESAEKIIEEEIAEYLVEIEKEKKYGTPSQ